MLEVLLAALACGAMIAAGCSAWLALPLRARVEQLELERPRFLAEMQGLLEACDESLERADSKRKRAENLERRHAQLQPELPQPIPMRRGSIMEKL